jgi:cellulose synthase/poly-beta-1,6-N-acetylglucosamine synthase-like glycosyltransferase
MLWYGLAWFLLFPYLLLLLFYKKWWNQLSLLNVPLAFQPSVRFTIVIPARNEEQHIAACLESISRLNYPRTLIEIVVVDDFSTDATFTIAASFKEVRVLKLSDVVQHPINSYKKKALEWAIQQANGDYIVTTDADCCVPPNWLRNFAFIIQQQKTVLIAAPVSIRDEDTAIKKFQSLDFLSLQGITAAAVGAGFHSMCNGANLCYSKQAFVAVQGFASIDHIASGDDMLLMHKLQEAYPGQIRYCHTPESIVTTKAVETVGAFFRQRIRWASKADQYRDRRIFAVLLGVYLLNAFLLVLFTASCFNPGLWSLLAICVVLKTSVELLFLFPVARFYQKERLLLYFPLAQPFHWMYIVAAGWLGKFGRYQWKGRTVQ